jgi:hypothetical protein
MYSRAAPATSIVKRPLSTVAVEPQPVLGTGAPSAAGSFVAGGTGGSSTGDAAAADGIGLAIAGGVSPTLAGWPSGARSVGDISLGCAAPGACSGAAASFSEAGAFISVAELGALASGSLLEHARASALPTKIEDTVADLS